MSIYTYRGYELAQYPTAIEVGSGTFWQASTAIMGYVEGVIDEISVIMQYRQPHEDTVLADLYLADKVDTYVVLLLVNGGAIRRFDVPARLSVRAITVKSNDEEWDVITVQVSSTKIFTGLSLPFTGNTYIRIGAPAPRFVAAGLAFLKGLMQVRFRSVIGNKPF